MGSHGDGVENHCLFFGNNKAVIPDELDVLFHQGKIKVAYSAGQVVFKQGSFVSKVIFLISGYVKMIKEGDRGKKCFVKVIGPGSFIFVPFRPDVYRHQYTAVALSEIQICEVQSDLFLSSIQKDAGLMNFFHDWYFYEQDFLLTRLLIMSTRNSHGKLASVLLYLNQFNTEDFSIFDYLSRKDIAELSLISLESTNKIIQELNNDKIIETERKSFVIKQIELLHKLSQIG